MVTHTSVSMFWTSLMTRGPTGVLLFDQTNPTDGRLIDTQQGWSFTIFWVAYL